MNETLNTIETYARQMMLESEIAHNFEHVHRVRQWSLRIAAAEGYPHLDRVQAAALLHDIGLVHGRAGHGPRGAEMAAAFLRQHRLFTDTAVAEIAAAIRCHNSLDGDAPLVYIIRDADILDLLGPVGIIRGCTSHAEKPEYPPGNIKGDTWGITAGAVTARFRAGQGAGPYLVDELNFQLSCYQNLSTQSAKEWARPLHAYMRTFLQALEQQVQMRPEALPQAATTD